MIRALIIATVCFLYTTSSWSYQISKVDDKGGNAKLAKIVYKVYIGTEPGGSGFRKEVVDALTQWKDALATRGVTLEIEDGTPPNDPVDINEYNKEVEAYNKESNPNLDKYPEIAKYEAKKNTINIYFQSSADIKARGGGAERGLASNYWSYDGDGHADKIEISDVFIPTDPPGGTADIQKLMIFNITLHEGGHVAGLDHYTEKQRTEGGGKIMITDATAFSERQTLGAEETKGLDAIYGVPPKVDVKDKAEPKESSSLPLPQQSLIPVGLNKVWEYSYDLTWLDGSELSYFQVQLHGSSIFDAWGSDGLEDWLVKYPGSGESYLDFFADGVYLNGSMPHGVLHLLSDDAPQEGWLVYQGNARLGLTPTPEPASILLLGLGMAGALLRGKRMI